MAKFLDQGPRVRPEHASVPKGWTDGPKRRDDGKAHIAQQILVVARDQQRLYEYVRRAFAGNPSVEVVLDRRRAERRSADRSRTPERRRGDRRLTLEVDEHLRTRGWAVVRLDVFRTVRMSHPGALR